MKQQPVNRGGLRWVLWTAAVAALASAFAMAAPLRAAPASNVSIVLAPVPVAGFGGGAGGIAPQTLPLILNDGAPIPANGGILIQGPSFPSVIVTHADTGEPVTGGVSAIGPHFVWLPEPPSALPVGTYRVAAMANSSTVVSNLEIIEAQDLEPPVLTGEPSLERRVEPPFSDCCRGWQFGAQVGTNCFEVGYNASAVLEPGLSSEAEPTQLGQFLFVVRPVELSALQAQNAAAQLGAPSPLQFSQMQQQYCFAVDALNIVSQELTPYEGLETCVTHGELGAIGLNESDLVGLGLLEHEQCELPPFGFEPEFCEVNRAECAVDAPPVSCRSYDFICNAGPAPAATEGLVTGFGGSLAPGSITPPRAGVGGVISDSDGEADTNAGQAGEADDASTGMADVGQAGMGGTSSGGGCSVGRSRACPWALLALGSALWLARRRASRARRANRARREHREHRARAGWGLLALASAVLTASPLQADPVDDSALLPVAGVGGGPTSVPLILNANAPIPGNGGLLIQGPFQPFVTVTPIDDPSVEVPGTVRALGSNFVWVPSSPLTPGAYKVSTDANGSTVSTNIEIGEPQTFEPPALTSEPQLTRHVESPTIDCCRGWQFGGEIQTSCFEIHYLALAVFTPGLATEAEPSQLGQFLFATRDARLSASEAMRAAAPLEVSIPVVFSDMRDEYCITVEAIEIATGAVTPYDDIETCVAHGDLEPVGLQLLDIVELGSLDHETCEMPPYGYDALFCDKNRADCEVDDPPVTCRSYDYICNGAPPPADTNTFIAPGSGVAGMMAVGTGGARAVPTPGTGGGGGMAAGSDTGTAGVTASGAGMSPELGQAGMGQAGMGGSSGGGCSTGHARPSSWALLSLCVLWLSRRRRRD